MRAALYLAANMPIGLLSQAAIVDEIVPGRGAARTSDDRRSRLVGVSTVSSRRV